MQCELCKKRLPLARENGKFVCIQYCLSEETKKKFLTGDNKIIGNIEIKVEKK